MSNEKQKVSAEQIEKLKSQQQKAKSDEVKQSIAEKLQNLNKPVNK